MTDIVSVLNLINYGFVLIFGIIVSFYFAGIQWEDNKRLFILTTVLFVLFQALFYVLLGENVLFKCYPVLIHIPFILIIDYSSIWKSRYCFFMSETRLCATGIVLLLVNSILTASIVLM